MKKDKNNANQAKIANRKHGSELHKCVIKESILHLSTTIRDKDDEPRSKHLIFKQVSYLEKPPKNCNQFQLHHYDVCDDIPCYIKYISLFGIGSPIWQ